MREISRNTLPTEIAKLGKLDRDQILKLWREKIGIPPQLASTELTRRWLAWELQARVRGGFDATTRRQLRILGRSMSKDPKVISNCGSSVAPGTVLSREWNGVTHRIVVLDEGFSWNGERYTSLSNIAFRITGTRWSGPRFFGLRKAKP